MNDQWLARFNDTPILVAAEHLSRASACLAGLEATISASTDLQAVLTAQSGDDDEFWTELGAFWSARLRPYVVRDGLLLLPVRGVLMHGFPYQFMGYATGYEYIWKAFQRGLDDNEVKGIALVIESPGGDVAGNFDLVDRMYAARGTKPVRAFACEYAYSAAYSIASAADRIVVSRTGGTGSIGILTAHMDVSKAMAEFGLKVTLIYAGKHKVDGNQYEALPDDVKARIQQRVDKIYGMFVDVVARNRNLDAAAVRATEALTYTAEEGIAVGLADSVGALDDALAEFAADVTNPDEGEDTMTTLTVASVKADHADIANALIDEGRTLGKAEAKADADKQLTGERARVAKLDGYATKYAGNAGALKIISEAKADGSTAEATADKLIEAGVPTQAAALDAIKGDDPSAAGASPAAPGGKEKAAVPQTEAGWTAEYEASAALKGEFLTVGSYVAFKKREAAQKGA